MESRGFGVLGFWGFGVGGGPPRQLLQWQATRVGCPVFFCFLGGGGLGFSEFRNGGSCFVFAGVCVGGVDTHPDVGQECERWCWGYSSPRGAAHAPTPLGGGTTSAAEIGPPPPCPPPDPSPPWVQAPVARPRWGWRSGSCWRWRASSSQRWMW